LQEQTDDQQQEWNQPKNDHTAPTNEEIDPLYDMIRVPKLDQLFVNTTFIQQVYVKHLPYFIGYSTEGGYAAFIDYINFDQAGYRLKIYEIITGKMIFSTFIPDVEGIFDTEEFLMAQQALDKGFGINTPPKKITWSEELNYQLMENDWIFNLHENKTDIKIRKKNTNLEWVIPTLFTSDSRDTSDHRIHFFAYPGKAEWVTILPIQLETTDKSDILTYNPVFINLDYLNFKNSFAGMEIEADNWLYGNFVFLYNQGIATKSKGFIAVSVNTSNQKKYNSKNQFNDYVNQWVYIDPTGRMNWYGNSQGIFNQEGEPIEEINRSFSYRITLKTNTDDGVLQHFVIDQLDEHSLELIRTIEFKWSSTEKKMEPIQKIQSL